MVDDHDALDLEATARSLAAGSPYDWRVEHGSIVGYYDGQRRILVSRVRGGWQAVAEGYPLRPLPGRDDLVKHSAMQARAGSAVDAATMHIRPDRPPQLPQEVPPIDPPGCWMALLGFMGLGFGALCVGWLTGGAQ